MFADLHWRTLRIFQFLTLLHIDGDRVDQVGVQCGADSIRGLHSELLDEGGEDECIFAG